MSFTIGHGYHAYHSSGTRPESAIKWIVLHDMEVGGTNAAEANYISSDAGQHAIAGAVADAAMEYLGRYERRVTGTSSLQDPPKLARVEPFRARIPRSIRPR